MIKRVIQDTRSQLSWANSRAAEKGGKVLPFRTARKALPCRPWKS